MAVEWVLRKLQRPCRSSPLSAALGAGALAWVKIYLALSSRLDFASDEAMRSLGQSPVVADAVQVPARRLAVCHFWAGHRGEAGGH